MSRPGMFALLPTRRSIARGCVAFAAGVILIACSEFDGCALSLAAFGDQGTGNCVQRQVADTLGRFCARQACDAGLLLGDNFYSTGVTSVDDPQWESKFASMYGDLGFPFYAALGNHDYGPGGADFSRGQFQVRYSQRDPRWIMPGEYYVFERSPAQFLALGTNLILHDQEVAAQASMFDQALQSASAPWRIAFGHHPYLSNGPHGNAGSYEGIADKGAILKKFFEEHLCGKIDLYLAGHDHSMQVIDGPPACPGLFVISGGGGRGLTSVSNRNGSLTRFGESAHGFAHLEIDPDRIRLRMVAVGGTVRYDQTFARAQ